jgi:hypothetical protein
MGGNMAARFLAAGHPVYGEAQRRDNAQDLIDNGLSPAQTESAESGKQKALSPLNYSRTHFFGGTVTGMLEPSTTFQRR